jgi:hypothetical protein
VEELEKVEGKKKGVWRKKTQIGRGNWKKGRTIAVGKKDTDNMCFMLNSMYILLSHSPCCATRFDFATYKLLDQITVNKFVDFQLRVHLRTYIHFSRCRNEKCIPIYAWLSATRSAYWNQ